MASQSVGRGFNSRPGFRPTIECASSYDLTTAGYYTTTHGWSPGDVTTQRYASDGECADADYHENGSGAVGGRDSSRPHRRRRMNSCAPTETTA